jgi:hypothetical protein
MDTYIHTYNHLFPRPHSLTHPVCAWCCSTWKRLSSSFTLGESASALGRASMNAPQSAKESLKLETERKSVAQSEHVVSSWETVYWHTHRWEGEESEGHKYIYKHTFPFLPQAYLNNPLTFRSVRLSVRTVQSCSCSRNAPLHYPRHPRTCRCSHTQPHSLRSPPSRRYNSRAWRTPAQHTPAPSKST